MAVILVEVAEKDCGTDLVKRAVVKAMKSSEEIKRMLEGLYMAIDHLVPEIPGRGG